MGTFLLLAGVYVTRMCQGDFHFDSGKSHNHCDECPGFGKCIGDYREAHCKGCNSHYFAGGQGFPCPKCDRKRGMIGDWDDDSDTEPVNDCVLSWYFFKIYLKYNLSSGCCCFMFRCYVQCFRLLHEHIDEWKYIELAWFLNVNAQAQFPFMSKKFFVKENKRCNMLTFAEWF